VRKHLSDEQYKLYKLIWDRFVASRRRRSTTRRRRHRTKPERRIAATGLGLRAAAGAKFSLARQYGKTNNLFGEADRAAGSREKSNEAAPERMRRERFGQRRRRQPSFDDDSGAARARRRQKRSDRRASGSRSRSKFAAAAAIHEGSLVRELEKRGIGRPSTYAEIISKVQARDYVEKLPGGQMKATELGKIVVDGLVSTALDFIDPSFTAKMEEELDEVEAGRLDRVQLLGRFYKRFRKELDVAKKQKRWSPEPERTDIDCPECGSKLLKRWSKNGWFLGCPYPKCKVTQDLGTARGHCRSIHDRLQVRQVASR
jgi:DNA topoisomerase-1